MIFVTIIINRINVPNAKAQERNWPWYNSVPIVVVFDVIEVIIKSSNEKMKVIMIVKIIEENI